MFCFFERLTEGLEVRSKKKMTMRAAAFHRARPRPQSNLPYRTAAGVQRPRLERLERRRLRPVQDINRRRPRFHYDDINCRRRPTNSAAGRYCAASRTWVTGHPICSVYYQWRWLILTIVTNTIRISWRTFSAIWVSIPRSTSECCRLDKCISLCDDSCT